MVKYELSERWIKASITGTIWAASEIVLGSFLHNLKVPFSGNILTGIGIVILISVSYLWKENGLFWRAGLICAIMKTISPSAVIFGPIIAIIAESLLLEMAVRLFGRTFLGFSFGSLLAMSWNLFQRIVNLLLFYGLNILDLYENLIKIAQKQMQIQTDIKWLPLIALFVVYGLMGLISAFVGRRIGQKLLLQPKKEYFSALPAGTHGYAKKTGSKFNYSLTWLFADLTMMVAALALLNYSEMIYWSSFILLISIVWSVRYQRALRQLTKPGFWLYFVLITMITAYVFSSVQGESWKEGLLIGLQMNFRAIVVVLGFAVLGTELYNPLIRSFFLKTSFRQLPAALELSFESLPGIIAHIPDFRTVMKNPVSVMHQIVLQGEVRLQEIKEEMNTLPKVFLISGVLGGGKSTFVRNVLEILKEKNRKVGGILTIRLTEKGETIGYDLLDLATNDSVKFLRLACDKESNRIGRFAIFPEGMAHGQKALANLLTNQVELVVIDEVGKLELRGDGWAGAIQNLVTKSSHPILLTVRNGFEQDVIDKWNITNYQILQVGISSPSKLAERMLKSFQDSCDPISNM